jgi:hypothetical protein
LPILPQKIFLVKKPIWVSKIAEFYADSKSVEMGEIKCFFQKFWANTMINLAKLEFSGFSAFFVYFLPVNFKRNVFQAISTHLKSA